MVKSENGFDWRKKQHPRLGEFYRIAANILDEVESKKGSVKNLIFNNDKVAKVYPTGILLLNLSK